MYLIKTYKFFVHLLTGQSELERICALHGSGTSLSCISQVDRSIEASTKLLEPRHKLHQATLNDQPAMACEAAAVADAVMQAKGFQKPAAMAVFRASVAALYGAHALYNALEELRKVAFEKAGAEEQNERNRAKLTGLWGDLCPQEQLKGLVSEQWKDIGFQGDNPATDFRGMGMLGLENLAYFARTHTELARRVVLTSQHPTNWFPFAITGIQLTKFLLDKTKNGTLRHHFYLSNPTQVLFGELFSATYARFHRFWVDEKGLITEFPFVFERFQAAITPQLEDQSKTARDLFE